MELKIEKKPKSVVEIKASLPAEVFESYRLAVLKDIQKNLELPGFRKGHVPADLAEKSVSAMNILEEMAEMAIGQAYPKILEQEKIDAIGRPAISITKIAANNPLEFVINTTVMPIVSLPDYKSLATKEGKEKEIVVTDEEVNKVLEELQQVRTKENLDGDTESDISNTDNTDDRSGDVDDMADADDIGKKNELPPLDDTFAQSFGNFSTINDLKTKIKENLVLEKQNATREKRRLKIVETVLDKTSVELPELLINAETEKMMARLEEDLKQMNMPYEKYLAEAKKTDEMVRQELLPDAEKRAKLELVLMEIARLEKIVLDSAEVEKELAHVLEHYSGADVERARSYVEHVLMSEKVFKLLEES